MAEIVTAYCAVQLVYLVEFARDGRLVPWLALARCGAAYAFLAFFLELWPTWRSWTPGRYVYQLFEWREASKLGLFALVFLGRGAGNTLNAFYLTEKWWRPLRIRRPVVGRVVTALPVATTALSMNAFGPIDARPGDGVSNVRLASPWRRANSVWVRLARP